MNADDPAPFTIVNPAGKAPYLVVCDHASCAVPAALDNLGLPGPVLRRHIGWDPGAGAVAGRLATRLDAVGVLGGVSRLVVDYNRGLDHPELIKAVSDGVPVPGNQDLDPGERASRIARWHAPYHAELKRRTDALVAAPAAVLISVHSFTPVMDGFVRPWHAALLHGDDDRLVAPVLAAFEKHYPALLIGDNVPYTGYSEHSHTVLDHAEHRGIANITFEIRQDLIIEPRGAGLWADLLATVLRDALAMAGLSALAKAS